MRSLIASAAFCAQVLVALGVLSAPSDGRVRVTHGPDKTKTVGSVFSKNADELIIRANNGAPVSVSTESISAVERSLGDKRNAAQGTLIGGGVGLTLGLILAIGASSGENPDFIGGDVILAGVVIITGVSAALGALIGYGIKVERWETVQLDDIKVSVFSSRKAPSVALTIKF